MIQYIKRWDECMALERSPRTLTRPMVAHGPMRAPLVLLALMLGGLLVPAGEARAASPLSFELNKLEPLGQGGSGCRAYFVAHNPDPQSLEQLRVDLVVFGTDGIVARRLALDLGPLPAGKTAVRLFDLAGLACDGIGRVLVNDVLSCRTGEKDAAQAEQDREACLDRLSVASRVASVPVLK